MINKGLGTSGFMGSKQSSSICLVSLKVKIQIRKKHTSYNEQIEIFN